MSLQTMSAAIDAGIAAPKLKHFATSVACAVQVADLLKTGDLVYVKGSRGVGLEVILGEFKKAKVVA